MLFLRAIPFSFAILWRYLLVLPLLLVAVCLFGLVAVIFAVLFGFLAPFLAVIFAVAFGLAAGIVPVMVGLRVGLQAKEIRPRNSYLGLMKPAIGYGFLEGFCVAVVLSICFTIFVLGTPLTMTDFLGMRGADDVEIMTNLYETSPFITAACLVIGGLVVAVLRAALLMPLAGASVGIDPDGRPHTPFYGFGQGLGTNLALVLVSYLGPVLAFPLVGFAIGALGLSDRMLEAAVAMERVSEFSDLLAIGIPGFAMLAVSLLILFWFFSLQCAGAALLFARHAEGFGKQRATKEEASTAPEEKPMPMTDLKELMRSRMPTTRN